jgi:hypothetical protein
MSRYIRSQDEVKVCIDKDGDLIIYQEGMFEVATIIVNIGNIQHFIDIIEMAVKDGYQGDDDEVV